jgi:hypothetical protein
MNQTEFLSAIELLLPHFTFELGSIGCIHGTKKVDEITFRDEHKNLINVFGNRYIYISGVMYPNTDNDFIYCTVRTNSIKRNYRCKDWYEHEHNNVFISGKNYDEVFEYFKVLVEKIHD